MSSVRIWHGWLIAGAQKPHASLSVYRQLHYTPRSSPHGGRWRLTVVRTGRRAPYAGARETHICVLCAPRHSARVRSRRSGGI
jgi:hypothetical protein